MNRRVPLICLLIALFLPSCGAQQVFVQDVEDNGSASTVQAADALVASDPGGPIPAPSLPAALEREAAAAQDPLPDAGLEKDGIDYLVVCKAPDAPELKDMFMEKSVLTRLKYIPVETLTGLEQRLNNALDEGRQMLHSLGYYSGTVSGVLKPAPPGSVADSHGADSQAEGSSGNKTAQRFVVEVNFQPGLQYRIGRTTIHGINALTAEENLAKAQAKPAGRGRDTALPHTLADVGLDSGAPAVADDVLAAVDRVREAYRRRGYPFAVISSTRYTLDYSTHMLEADVWVNPGEFTLMGAMTVQGQHSVKDSYLDALRTWNPGQVWDQNRIDRFRDALRQSGLFQDIVLEPSKQTDKMGRRDIVATLKTAPERTVGGALKYDTSFGPGVQSYWQNRNFTGRGDDLRFEMPLWLDMQELSANYRLPYFLSNKQDLIAQGGILHQDLDAYKLLAARVAGGIERRVSRHWALSAQATAEGGWQQDPDEPRRDYLMFGLPFGATFNTTDSLLNAVRGGRVLFSLGPYSGKYGDSFSVLRSRIDLQRFIPLVEDDWLVLALRGSVGALFGAGAQQVPHSLRFYSGGGGSVRGYKYQSLGPRNSDDDPLGGRSLLEVTAEARWRITEEWGVVTFLDGGMVYEKFDLGKDMRWGAGLGLRYYTSIGPLRLDVATPLNPRSSDDFLQFYISIGQSF